jgi:hypothetical protein
MRIEVTYCADGCGWERLILEVKTRQGGKQEAQLTGREKSGRAGFSRDDDSLIISARRKSRPPGTTNMKLFESA